MNRDSTVGERIVAYKIHDYILDSDWYCDEWQIKNGAITFYGVESNEFTYRQKSIYVPFLYCGMQIILTDVIINWIN